MKIFIKSLIDFLFGELGPNSWSFSSYDIGRILRLAFISGMSAGIAAAITDIENGTNTVITAFAVAVLTVLGEFFRTYRESPPHREEKKKDESSGF